jgi:hypothetical protein
LGDSELEHAWVLLEPRLLEDDEAGADAPVAAANSAAAAVLAGMTGKASQAVAAQATCMALPIDSGGWRTKRGCLAAGKSAVPAAKRQHM